MEFGILIAPFEEMLGPDQPLTAARVRRAVALVQSGQDRWLDRWRSFCTLAPDLVYAAQRTQMGVLLHRLAKTFTARLDVTTGEEPEFYRRKLDEEKAQFRDLLDSVPVTLEPALFEANTPFTAYLRIREAVQTARRRLHYFDRYLKPQFFPLFLAELDRGVVVRLVTTARSIPALKDVSALARQEFTDYQLLQASPDDLHDRNLRVDDHVFSLGPGVDRAGMALSNFGPSASDPAAHSSFDQLIAQAVPIHS